jgi:hypothetical protein
LPTRSAGLIDDNAHPATHDVFIILYKHLSGTVVLSHSAPFAASFNIDLYILIQIYSIIKSEFSSPPIASNLSTLSIMKNFTSILIAVAGFVTIASAVLSRKRDVDTVDVTFFGASLDVNTYATVPLDGVTSIYVGQFSERFFF